MEKRIQIDVAEPSAYKAMFGLENYLDQTALTQKHRDLISIRASQLNGCAFCIDMHTSEALKNGEDQQRIFLLDAWRKSGLFTEEEKIILQMTEEVTVIDSSGLSSKTYQKAVEKFDDHYFSYIIMAIVTINAWNRIGISSLKPPIK